MSDGSTSPPLVGAPLPTHNNSPPNSPGFFGDGDAPSPPIPPPARRVLGKPPRHLGAPQLSEKRKRRINREGIASDPTGKGRKTKKRKSKSRRRRNGRTYRRS